jgi:UrcA family protein
MYTNRVMVGLTAWVCLTPVCLTCTGPLAAQGREVSVSLQVSAKGLDLRRPEGAQAFYLRINRAAYTACTSGNRVGLAPPDNQQACIENSLAAAVRAVRVPMLTQAYLANHTLRQAEAAGIYVPAQVAAK